ncbi:hypothetical protein BC830DRAFT_1260891 [Chytriomyces sp. MP71]|nr:hypothetical protein BC830DRAFT_1260891 [Chytriomyces sp. MP71]
MQLLTVIATVAAVASALRVNKPINQALRAPVTGASAPPSPITLPTAVAFQSVVNPLLTKVDNIQITNWMTTLTQFPERYYTSQNGVKAANWIQSTVQALTVPSGAKLTVSLFKHAKFAQPSVIARYEAATATTLQGIVITGSHFDTAANGSPQGVGGPNPAADDCASGSVAVFETLRVLTSNGFIPGRPIEFHWYAAEEEGLYGSHEIANAYAAKGEKVVSYLNLDQSGYVKPGTTPQIGIFTDYCTSAATSFVTATAKAYSGLPVIGGQTCGYECTDNAAWYDAGYNSALAFESSNANAFPYNDQVNSDGSPLDTLDQVNVDHVAAFAKNTIGFVVELSLAGSGPQPSSTVKTTASSVVKTSAQTSSSVRPSSTVAPKCNHSECTTGPLLNKGCSACASAVCQQDSYCCTNQWDSQCVSEVNQYCTTVQC